MNPAISTTVVSAFRRSVVPLASYYAVTLALPLANGAAQSGSAFVEHALVVLVIPPIVIVLACAVRGVAHTFRRLCASMRRWTINCTDVVRLLYVRFTGP
jgi:hypothetical protein